MAYAYQAIDDLMNGTQQQNQNVFGDGSQQGAPQTQVMGAGGQAPGVKTSTEGDLSQGGGGGVTSQSPKQAQVSTDQSNRNAQTAAFKANVGKTQKPAALAGVQSNIDQANQGLAQRAADYSAQQKAQQNYGLDTSILDQAIGGQQSARSKTGELLNRTTTNPIGTFDPGSLQVKDASLLGSDAGIKELAARGQGPTYTPGMAAFDAMLLRRDPNFQNQVQDLQRQANELEKKGATEKERVEKEVADYGAQNLKTSQEAAKSYLGSQRQAIQDENVRQAAAENEKLKALDRQALAAQAEADARAKAKAQLDAQFGAGRADKLLASQKVNPADYLSFANDYGADQFYSKEDADRFNAINSLLGLGGTAALESSPLANPYSVNSDALFNSLYQPAFKARGEQDISNQAQIDRILRDAQNRADQDDRNRALNASNYGLSLNTLGQSLGNDAMFANVKPFMTNENIRSFNDQYAQYNPIDSVYGTDLVGRDVLQQNEVDQLNALSSDLGLGANYNVGQYAAGGPKDMFNSDSYKNALLGYLSDLGNQQYQPIPFVDPQAQPALGSIDPETGAMNVPGNIPEDTGPKGESKESVAYKLKRGADKLSKSLRGK